MKSVEVHRPALLELSLDEVASRVVALGGVRQHAITLRRVLLAGLDPEKAPLVPVRVLEGLRQTLEWTSCDVAERHPAPDGSEKFLLRLGDRQLVEAVRLPGFAVAPTSRPTAIRERSARVTPSACLSTQVGCAMACRFCASGLERVARSLRAHELLEQLVHLRRVGPVSRLVFMGSGEPTQNLRAVVTAMQVMRDEGALGPRSIVLSTVGPPSAIDRLSDLDLKFTLALSLHSAVAATRADLIPTQPNVDPRELVAAAERFAARTGRAWQAEVVLLAGINDDAHHARALAELLHRARCHVSVIRWNATPGTPFVTPPLEDAERFVRTLQDAGISTRLRRTVGSETTAACGQLRGARSGVESEGVSRRPTELDPTHDPPSR